MAQITITIEIEKCDDKDGEAYCPYCFSIRTAHAGFAFDYFCSKANQKIAGYVEWPSEMPKVPEWCPLRVNG